VVVDNDQESVVSKVADVDPDVKKQDEELGTDRTRSGEAAKPMSPAMQDWMRRIQEAGVTMANNEDVRKAIAKRLF